MSGVKVNVLRATNFTVTGANAGSVQAANLNFNNLDVSGNLTVKGVQVATVNELANKANVNNPKFTGSVDVSGSLTVNGPIEGVIFNTVDGVTTVGGPTSIVGSLKIAKSPFHSPKLNGPYGVDLHNVVVWKQYETTTMIDRNLEVASYVLTDASAQGVVTRVVSDFIALDGNNKYIVPTKYGTVILDAASGNMIYDASRQLFLTPPMPTYMDIYLPVANRSPNVDFNFWDVSGNDYYLYRVGGNPNNIFLSPHYFYDDTAPDSVYALIRNYDLSNNIVFSSFTDLTDGIYEGAGVLISTLRNARPNIDTDYNKRCAYIDAVFNLFGSTRFMNTSTKVNALKTAIKNTGGYARVLSHKWHVNRSVSVNDTSGIIQTIGLPTSIANLPTVRNFTTYNDYLNEIPNLPNNLTFNINTASPTQKDVPAKLPLFFTSTASASPYLLSEVASRGIVAIAVSTDYINTYNCKYPRSIPSLGTTGFQEWNTQTQIKTGDTFQKAAKVTYISEDSIVNENVIWATYNYDATPGTIQSNKRSTGAININYAMSVFAETKNILNSVGLTEQNIDYNSVVCMGYSRVGLYAHALNYLQNSSSSLYKTVNPNNCVFKAVANVFNENLSDVKDNQALFVRGFRTTSYEGFKVPSLYIDNHHDRSGGVGRVEMIQTAFRTATGVIRDNSFYVGIGNDHLNFNAMTKLKTALESYASAQVMSIKADGFDYPDDNNNNLLFNSSYISYESQALLMLYRLFTGTALFIQKNTNRLGTNTAVTNDIIRSVLPGNVLHAPLLIPGAYSYTENSQITKNLYIGGMDTRVVTNTPDEPLKIKYLMNTDNETNKVKFVGSIYTGNYYTNPTSGGIVMENSNNITTLNLGGSVKVTSTDTGFVDTSKQVHNASNAISSLYLGRGYSITVSDTGLLQFTNHDGVVVQSFVHPIEKAPADLDPNDVSIKNFCDSSSGLLLGSGNLTVQYNTDSDNNKIIKILGNDYGLLYPKSNPRASDNGLNYFDTVLKSPSIYGDYSMQFDVRVNKDTSGRYVNGKVITHGWDVVLSDSFNYTDASKSVIPYKVTVPTGVSINLTSDNKVAQNDRNNRGIMLSGQYLSSSELSTLLGANGSWARYKIKCNKWSTKVWINNTLVANYYEDVQNDDNVARKEGYVGFAGSFSPNGNLNASIEYKNILLVGAGFTPVPKYIGIILGGVDFSNTVFFTFSKTGSPSVFINPSYLKYIFATGTLEFLTKISDPTKLSSGWNDTIVIGTSTTTAITNGLQNDWVGRDFKGKWVVINREFFTSVYKVRAAIKAGAVGVIAINHTVSTPPVYLEGWETDVTIPYLVVEKTQGQALFNRYLTQGPQQFQIGGSFYIGN